MYVTRPRFHISPHTIFNQNHSPNTPKTMTKRLLIFVLPLLVVLAMHSCGTPTPKTPPERPKTVLAEDDSYEILREVVDSAEDQYDVDVVALWVKDQKTGTQTKLLQTVRPNGGAWYVDDGKNFIPAPIDSINAIYNAYIYSQDPLRIIVEGCPDMRNIYSYFIDVPARKAWYVPANSGYLVTTDYEGYMIFQSYRYGPDGIGGRYTFLQVFNDEGEMVDSLSLERLYLEQLPDDAFDDIDE